MNPTHKKIAEAINSTVDYHSWKGIKKELANKIANILEEEEKNITETCMNFRRDRLNKTQWLKIARGEE